MVIAVNRLPKVSMVVPCYNKANEIGSMLESVYNQKWDNIELIFVYNTSDDATLTVLEGWIPRLKKRGYEVVFIDKGAPMGLPAAVRDGMMVMTGEYFCTVDCDDLLSPDYASDMARWLMDHPGTDVVCCNHEKIQMPPGGRAREITTQNLRTPADKDWLLNYLFARVQVTVWILMVRVEYIKKCRIVENFVAEPRTCQEPQINIPLAAGGGHVDYLPQILYTHRFVEDGIYMLSQHVKILENGSDQIAILCEKTVLTLDIDENYMRYLMAVMKLCSIKLAYYHSVNFTGDPERRSTTATRVAEEANRLFMPSPGVSVGDVLKSGYRAFFMAVENCILGENNPFLSQANKCGALERADGGRIIGYGAKGTLANELLPALKGTPLEPDTLWDAAAKDGDEAHGTRVEFPNMELLTERDVLLVIPRNRSVMEYVKAATASMPLRACLYHFDILEYLAAWYYPKLQTECAFVFEPFGRRDNGK